MQQLIELIEIFIEKKFGEDSLKVFKTIGIKENVSEFDIAETLNKNINYVRNLLYKLYSWNLVYSTRKKDRQKGWYIYYWTFNFKHARDLLIINKNKKLGKLKAILNKDLYEEIYLCPNGCITFKIGDAMEQGFKCPECESVLKKKESGNDDEKVKKDIENLKKDIELLKRPIEIKLIKEEEEKKTVVKKVQKKVVKKGKKKIKKKLVKKKPKKVIKPIKKEVIEKKGKKKVVKKGKIKIKKIITPIKKEVIEKKVKKGLFGKLRRIKF